ncbi:MAG: O-antigen ligase family protein [Bacteroidia bacterium]|nr:O-antigen ligase family protein [Bacteroidia bacterium]
MERSFDIKLLYAISAAYLIAVLVGISQDFLWILVLPAIGLILYMGMYALDKLMLFVAFTTPLSINLAETGLGIGVSLPTEPILFGIMLIFFLKVSADNGFDRKILFHPVSLAILFHLGWMFFTSVTSTMPLVSIKHTIARLCFVTVFFYLATQLFRKIENINIFIWSYIIPLLIVIGYTIVRHASFGFTEKSADWVMSPFYNDHTQYAAVIAMFIPLLIVFVFNSGMKFLTRFAALIVTIILSVAIILSFTRAAWLGLVGSVVLFFIYILKIDFKLILFAVLLVSAVLFNFRTEIMINLERNREESSTDMQAHLQSMSNISTDASNVERLNRWACAWRMFQAKPIFGWGPGTYQFQYAPFQISSEKTIISTNSGDRGNAHSEYIGPLAEQGVLGTLGILAVIFAVLTQGSLLIARAKDPKIKYLAMGLLLGLVSYWVHGTLNNFLDTDKASIPFWGFAAALLALDIYHSRQSREGMGNRE